MMRAVVSAQEADDNHTLQTRERTKMATRPASGKTAEKRARKSATKKTTKSASSKTAESNSGSVYQLKVRLQGARPPIWRRLLVPADATLGDLNFIIQAAMGWQNCHLHEFVTKAHRYADPQFALDDTHDENKVTLQGVAAKVGAKLGFCYDFGDGWEHEITVEKILPRDPKRTYPCCVAGRRAGPPEDCGGIWGYKDLLEILNDPKHPEHKERMDWTGGPIDPEAFDIDEINEFLAEMARFMAKAR
jgi:hypothetical protein